MEHQICADLAAHGQRSAPELNRQLSTDSLYDVASCSTHASARRPAPPRTFVPRLNLPLPAYTTGSPPTYLPSQQRWGSVPHPRSRLATNDAGDSYSSSSIEEVALRSPTHSGAPDAAPHHFFSLPVHLPSPFLTGSFNGYTSSLDAWHTHDMYTGSGSLQRSSPGKTRGPEHSAPCASQHEEALSSGSQRVAVGLSADCVDTCTLVGVSSVSSSEDESNHEARGGWCVTAQGETHECSLGTSHTSADENAYPPSGASSQSLGSEFDGAPEGTESDASGSTAAAESFASFSRTVSSDGAESSESDGRRQSCPASFMHDEPNAAGSLAEDSHSSELLDDTYSDTGADGGIHFDADRALERVSEASAEQVQHSVSRDLPSSPRTSGGDTDAGADGMFEYPMESDASTDVSSATEGAASPRDSAAFHSGPTQLLSSDGMNCAAAPPASPRVHSTPPLETEQGADDSAHVSAEDGTCSMNAAAGAAWLADLDPDSRCDVAADVAAAAAGGSMTLTADMQDGPGRCCPEQHMVTPPAGGAGKDSPVEPVEECSENSSAGVVIADTCLTCH